MTLGEAKDKVYMLLDEHSAGGVVEHDRDLELKMAYFFDIAQKLLSQVKRTEYPMPADFRSVYRIWRDGKIATTRYHWRKGRMIVPEGDGAREILVEYFADPRPIPPDAEDGYEFEIASDAAECMPYYVAAQHLLPDLVMDYSGMLRMFDRAVSMLDTGLPGENVRVAQTFYRG